MKESQKRAINKDIDFSNLQNTKEQSFSFDVFNILCDLQKSNGLYLYDTSTESFFLDMTSFFGSLPIGFNHPKLTTPEMIKKLGIAAVHKPSQEATNSIEQADFIETFQQIAMLDKMIEIENYFSNEISPLGGNPVDMVRTKKILEIIEEDDLIQNAVVVGKYLLSKLFELQKQNSEIIFNARGKGLFCFFDLRDIEDRNKLITKLYQKKMIVLPCGESGIKLCPTLTCEREHADKAISLLKDTIKEIK